MVIDRARCSGCQACATACKVATNIPSVGAHEADRGRVLNWIRFVEQEENDGEHR